MQQTTHLPVVDPAREYAWGTDAAQTFGVADAASVWRQIARHGDDYPGVIEVVQIGRRKVVRRDQLVAFARWFAEGPGLLDKRIKVGPAVEVESKPVSSRRPAGATSGARRAALREAIARLTE